MCVCDVTWAEYLMKTNIYSMLKYYYNNKVRFKNKKNYVF